ncbi:MAG: ribosome-associated translation inhibitor RaiA [Vampirovibrionales bacterium]|nr:ribosome-associated translation inhibitor RaiA [Vampirovibrionales bacterium]
MTLNTLKLVASARNFELTDAIKQYIDEKFSRVGDHFQFVSEIHIFLNVEKNPRIPRSHVAEATVHTPGAVLRLEAASENLYASIDSLLDKVNRQLAKQKDVRYHKSDKGGPSIRHLALSGTLEDDDVIDELQLMREEAEDFIHGIEDWEFGGATLAYSQAS